MIVSRFGTYRISKSVAAPRHASAQHRLGSPVLLLGVPGPLADFLGLYLVRTVRRAYNLRFGYLQLPSSDFMHQNWRDAQHGHPAGSRLACVALLVRKYGARLYNSRHLEPVSLFSSVEFLGLCRSYGYRVRGFISSLTE